MSPDYVFHVFVCQNQRQGDDPAGSCLPKGSDEIMAYLRKRVKEMGLPGIRINKSGCLGQCRKGPVVVVYPEGAWYAISNLEDAETFIQIHLTGQGRVEELLL